MVRKIMFGGRRHRESFAVTAGKFMRAAVDAFASRLNSIEFGGDDGTVAISSTTESMAEILDLETLG